MIEWDPQHIRHHIDAFGVLTEHLAIDLVPFFFGVEGPAEVCVVGDRIVMREVDGFEEADLLEITRSARHKRRDEICEAGENAGPKNACPTPTCRCFDSPAIFVTERATVYEIAARHVDARLKELHYVVDVKYVRRIGNAVRLEREELVQVAGCGDPDLVHSAERPDVLPLLVGTPGITSNEFEFGVAHYALCSFSTNVARGPLYDAVAHQNAPVLVCLWDGEHDTTCTPRPP